MVKNKQQSIKLSDLQTRKGILMPLRENVSVVVGHEEEIFGEKYCYVVQKNRILKVKKDAVQYV